MLATRRTDGGIRGEVGRVRAVSNLCRAGPPASAAGRTRGRTMGRQPSRRSVLRMLLSPLTRKAPEQARQPGQPPPRPAPDDRENLQAYWKEQVQPWLKEPDIDMN